MKKFLAFTLTLALAFGVLSPTSLQSVSLAEEVMITEAPTEKLLTEEVLITETPTEEALITEEPTVEATTTEAPTVDATITEEPTVEATITEAPTVEATTTEAPTVDATITEAPTVEATITEEPTVEATITEAPTVEATITEEPTVDASITEEPTVEATITEEPTVEATITEEPTVEATITEEPTVDATITEEPTVDATITEEPTVEATITEAPTEEPLPTEDAPAVSGPAWVLNGEVRLYGTLETLIQAQIGTIYINTEKVLELEGYTLDTLKGVNFAPDRELFPDAKQVVILSQMNPDGNTKEGTLFLWVGLEEDVPTPNNGLSEVTVANDDEVLEMEIQVIPQGYIPGEACTPVFSLSAMPDLSQRQAYAVSQDSGTYQPLSSNNYAPESSGEYRFAVLDGDGSVLARSSKFEVIIAKPTPAPTEEPTIAPTQEPTAEPTPVPTEAPTVAAPTESPLPENNLLIETPVTLIAENDLLLTTTFVEIDLLVTATDYYPGEVSDIAPLFTLSGLPAEGGYTYGVSVNDDTPTALSGNVYTASSEGSYSLRFVILDALGNTSTQSAKYELTLDFSTQSAIKKQAWMLDSTRNPVYGSLEGLLAQSSQGTIYIQSTETIVLSVGASALSGIALVPDPGIFSTGSYFVVASDKNPADISESQGGLYIWVEATPQSGTTPIELELMATPENFVAGTWTNVSPTFALTLIPDTVAGIYLGVIPSDGMPIRLAQQSFTATDEGAYTLTFAAMDGASNILAKSASYAVAFDKTAPILRAAAKDSTLTVSAVDALSGITGISLDKGASWQAMTQAEDGSFTYSLTVKQETTFAEGMIQVKDAAGNVSLNTASITLTTQSKSSFSKPSGSSGSNRTTTHTSSTTTTITAHNGVTLIVADSSMTELTLGGESLDLSLYLVDDDSNEAHAPFTAQLAKWNGEMDDAANADTLILSAANLSALSDDETFVWTFNGMVYKKLAASGIDYLVLQVGDQVTAISTAGFTAGVRYSLLRAEGLASKAFDYTVYMDAPNDLMQMQLSAEGESYQVSADPATEIYYYNVYTGTMEMMDMAFGAYTAGEGEPV